MKRQKKQYLSVSQNFYDGIMARVDSSMKAVRAAQEETDQVKGYIYEYLKDGKAPKRRLEGRQLLTVMLLKAEIEKAIARSAKARQRSRRRKEAAVAATQAEALSTIRTDEPEEEAEAEEAPVTVMLNRRQRRLREMALRRMARKSGQKNCCPPGRSLTGSSR